MVSLSTLIGPLSLAAGVLALLIALAILLWASGKIEGYDPINEILRRDNPALGLRCALFAIATVLAVLGVFAAPKATPERGCSANTRSWQCCSSTCRVF